MKTLPEHAAFYKRSPEFSEYTIPGGLLRQHQTKGNTWAKIVIREGQLLYRILEPKIEDVYLSEDTAGIIEPDTLHEVKPVGKVKFYLEFYKSEKY